MESKESEYFCQGCSIKLKPEENPCPYCGAKGRAIYKTLIEEINLQDSLKRIIDEFIYNPSRRTMIRLIKAIFSENWV